MNPQETQKAIEDKTGFELEDGVAFFDGYVDSVIGTTEDGRLVYSYDGLVEETAKMFTEDSSEESDQIYTDAQEWVDYNVVRTVPYMGDLKPIIVYLAEDMR